MNLGIHKMLCGLLLALSFSVKGAPIERKDTVLQCQPQLSNQVLEYRIDSLGQELSILIKVLQQKGIDLAHERKKLAVKDSVFIIPLDSTQILRKSKYPTHTLTVFLDLQCPYCVRLAPKLEKLLDDRQDVQISIRHFPLSFHERALPSARALWAAGRQAKFAQYYWKLALDSANQSLSESSLSRVAMEVGLEKNRFDRDRESQEALAAILRDQELAKRLWVEGTPTLFFDGKRVVDPRTIFTN